MALSMAEFLNQARVDVGSVRSPTVGRWSPTFRPSIRLVDGHDPSVREQQVGRCLSIDLSGDLFQVVDAGLV